MYWQQGTKKLVTIPLPFYITGSNFDATLTLVTEAGEDLSGVALMCLNPAHAGYIQAKRASESAYSPIGFLSDATCFLGDFAAETQTDIDFRVSIPSGTPDGLIVVNVVLVQDFKAPGSWCVNWSTLLNEDWPTSWGENWPSN